MQVGLRLFLVSLGLILVAAIASGIFLERRLRGAFERRAEIELSRRAELARLVLEGGGDWDALAKRLEAHGAARVSIVDREGRALGGAAEPGDAPEVPQALAEPAGRVVSRRDGATLHAALRFERPPPGGVLRFALPLGEVRAGSAEAVRWIILASLFGVAAAALLGAFASRSFARELSALVESARALRTGGKPIPVSSQDELGRLAGNLNQMANSLEASVRALAEERARFETVLVTMSDALITLDADQRVILTNPAAQSLLGLGAAPAGQLLVEAVRAPDLNALAARGAVEAASGEVELLSPVRRRVLVSARPLPAGGTVLTLHDVSEMRRLEAVRRDFVANVSHELRTPVSIIHANAETLLDGGLDDEERAPEFVDAIHRNSARLARIIADLLDLSRIEAGRYELAPAALELGPLAEHAILGLVARAKDKGIALRVAVEGRVRADRRALDQILFNLVENAVKYTPEGGNIELRSAPTEAGVRLEVRDDGPGIEPHHRQRVFERFYRVDPGRSREMGGTGLGLAIVKHLAEAMGARVGVEGARPHGAVFWIELPS